MDIAIIQTHDGEFDIAIENGDLKHGDDLRTSVLLSLFTNRHAEPDDDVEQHAGAGWWASPEMGSRLWLLQRTKQTQETLVRAQEYADEALAWLVDDGIVHQVEVETEWVHRGVLGISVAIEMLDNRWSKETFEYSLENT